MEQSAGNRDEFSTLMEQEHDEAEDPRLGGLLRDWAKDAREGRASLPSPAGTRDVNEIFESVNALERGTAQTPGPESHLVRVARQAEQADFRPWEQGAPEGIDSSTGPASTRPPVVLRLWPAAAAAAVVLAAGIGLWQMGDRGRQFDIRRIEAGLNLRVGYSDFDSAVRGDADLRSGTTAYIYFTPLTRVYYSILWLDGNHKLHLDKANAQNEEHEDGIPYKVPWTLEAESDEDTRETVFVVVSEARWEQVEQFVSDAGPRLSGSRDERIKRIMREIHDARGDLAVAAETYIIRSTLP